MFHTRGISRVGMGTMKEVVWCRPMLTASALLSMEDR
jgi:hypothetical protein